MMGGGGRRAAVDGSGRLMGGDGGRCNTLSLARVGWDVNEEYM